MKNPQSKPYTGPKTFKKLIKNVPNLYGVSCASTSNPLYLSEISSDLLKGTGRSHLSASCKDRTLGSRRRVHRNLKEIDLTLVSEVPTAKKRILKSRQELIRRSGNIWANRKERLGNLPPLALRKRPVGPEEEKCFLSRPAGIRTDFWDLKKTSKSCLLSSQTRLTPSVNGLMASSILGSSHSDGVSKVEGTQRGRQLISSHEGKTIVILKNYAALATKN